MAKSTGKVFGILFGVLLLVIVLQLVADVIASATNVTGIAATILDFLPGIVGIVALFLMLKDAGMV